MIYIKHDQIYLFVWLVAIVSLGHLSQTNIFHSYRDVINTGEVVQILTYAQHLLLLSSEGSLALHSFSDTYYPFIWPSSNTLDSHTCCQAFCSGAVTTCLATIRSVAAGIWTPNLPNSRRTLLLTGLPRRHCNIINLVVSLPGKTCVACLLLFF